jgi:hypothetical protein
MAFCITNGMGDSVDEPSLAQMRKFHVDEADEEHGAAWLSTDHHVLEWSGTDGRLVFESTAVDVSDLLSSRHLLGVSRERTLELWQLLAAGRLADVGTEGHYDPPKKTEVDPLSGPPSLGFLQNLGG